METGRTRACAAGAAIAACLIVAPACDGGDDEDGAGGETSRFADAGFGRVAKTLPVESHEVEVPPEEQVLPPEQLWSPKNLGFGKKGSSKKGCFPATEKDYKTVLARAGDLEILVEDFTAEFHTHTLDATKNDEDTPETRKQMLVDLVDQELLAFSARKKGYESKQVGSLLQKRELAKMIVKDMREQAASEISEEAYKKYYRSHPDKYMIHPDQRRILQIVVKGKKNAIGLINRLREDEVSAKEFKKQAKALTVDPAGKETGGKTAWFDREGMGEDGRVIPEKHSHLIFKIKKEGEIYKAPLRSAKGWHVIMLLDTREEKWTPFKHVRYQIVAKFVGDRQQVLLDKHLDALKKTHPVSLNIQILDKISPVPCL